ncbi:hypothetical protein ETB97_008222 [Aspergillus alliaceus]|uniref:Uncharacterized protein n=1 Tax=Petromyces alliaceus TaxID=209559 RepID=A0A8H6EAY2_PETAA|nr:hypothetical protein ETB97_008222 [Aspergillus burnettii]
MFFDPPIPLRYECAPGWGLKCRRREIRKLALHLKFKQCRQILRHEPPASHLDPFTAPMRIILSAIETLGEGVIDLIMAASDVHYQVEQHAKGSPPKGNPQPVEGEFNVHNDATTVKVPYIPN